MKKDIKRIIEKYKNIEKPLIMILHEIQDKYGYLSNEAMNTVSEELNISINEIYSVASFYKDFKMQKAGKYQINVCTGTVCYVNGSNEILEELENILGIHEGEVTKDNKFSIDTSRCLGCCSMAPVMMINDKVYGNLKVSDIKRILKEYE